jgi:hypothetical protein
MSIGLAIDIGQHIQVYAAELSNDVQCSMLIGKVIQAEDIAMLY